MGDSGDVTETTRPPYGTDLLVRIISRYSLFTQTSLASRVVDALGDTRTRLEVQVSLLEYLDTDTIWSADSCLACSLPFSLTVAQLLSR